MGFEVTGVDVDFFLLKGTSFELVRIAGHYIGVERKSG